jgi:hypothetical protein
VFAIAVPVEQTHSQRAVQVVVAQRGHGDLGFAPARVQTVFDLDALPYRSEAAIFVQSEQQVGFYYYYQ